MTDKDRCSRMADECERLAKRTVDARDRSTLLSMAKVWRELGGEASDAEAVPPPAGPAAPLKRS